MKLRHYVIYRVLVRLNEQAEAAVLYGRTADAQRLGGLIGRLEYAHFGAGSFESWFNGGEQ